MGGGLPSLGGTSMALGNGGSGARPSSLLLGPLWALLVFALMTVLIGARAWVSPGDVVVPLHVVAALICLFGSVWLLARLRLDFNRRRTAGNLVEHAATSIRTNTTIALTSWVLGPANLGLVALQVSAG